MSTFKFIPSKEMKIQVTEKQLEYISSYENIKICCGYDVVVAYDIFLDDINIGFAMIEKVTKRTFFLWDYAIDVKYQNKGYGTKALLELIEILKREYKIRKLTTTYIWGNDIAKHVYEKVGFIETSVVDEPGCHEVNMKLSLTSKK